MYPKVKAIVIVMSLTAIYFLFLGGKVMNLNFLKQNAKVIFSKSVIQVKNTFII